MAARIAYNLRRPFFYWFVSWGVRVWFSGAFIFERCIVGFLRREEGRTVVLVTHSVALTLPCADHVILLETGGKVAGQGRPPPPGAQLPSEEDAAPQAGPKAGSKLPSVSSAGDLRAFLEMEEERPRWDPAVAALVKRYRSHKDLEDLAQASTAAAAAAAAASEAWSAKGTAAGSAGGASLPPSSVAGRGGEGPGGAKEGGEASTKASKAGASKAGDAFITTNEERARGAASFGVYSSYLAAAGGLEFALPFLAACVAYSALNPVQSVALASWVNAMEKEGAEFRGEESSGGGGGGGGGVSASAACARYAAAAVAFVCVTLVRNLLLPAGSLRASRALHDAMVRAVLRAPVAW